MDLPTCSGTRCGANPHPTGPIAPKLVRMARSTDYTVAYDRDGAVVDLCKILFGADGSYYVTAPYHPADRAIAAKYTVNYARQNDLLELEEAQELAVVDDDERRLKVAHHVDGFLQFSGQGIRSGLTGERAPKGIGTFSWPLTEPTLGPAFQLAFSDPIACGRPSRGRAQTVVLRESDLAHMRRNISGLTIVGYYFPLQWREFVHRGFDGEMWLHLVHPRSQAVIPLRALLAPMDCGYAGFIGVEARPHGLGDTRGEPTFFVSTATGNLRRNADGDLLGDQLLCVYPQPDLDTAHLPTLNYPLPAPPYTAPPGTTEILPDAD